MVNDHVGSSKIMWVGQWLLDLNDGHFDTFEAEIRKKKKTKKKGRKL